MPRDDYFRIVYKILDYLYAILKEGKVADTETLRNITDINEAYWRYVIEEMSKSDLIQGLTITRAWGGEYVYFDTDSIKITPIGIEYLQENHMMKKVYRAVKGVTDIVPKVF